MPELPEVETIVNELRKKIVGLKITDVWVDWAKTVKQAGGIDNFREQTQNKKILSVRRRAKYIIITIEGDRKHAYYSPERRNYTHSIMDIEGEKTLFIHQKISGHLLYGKWRQVGKNWVSQVSGPLKDDRQNGYIRLVLFLSNGYQLALSDLRRFAKVILVDDNNVNDLKEIRELGPEPLEINFKQFKDLFIKKRGRIKQVLMDPTFIAGIGNIYSDEILWDAGYHPLSRTENLNEKDLKKIFTSIRKILNQAVKYQGASVDDYRLPSGKKGRYQEMERAYHQTGNKCKKKDGGIIKRLKIGGRSAHFCDKHQILK